MAHYMDTSEYDWQSSKSVIECNRHMWKHRLLCDVKFRVGAGREIIEAHKYVLASRSCVFYAMFSDAMLESRGHVIDIPDIEPEIFRAVMQFLYYEEIKIDLNNVLAILYISKKYAIQELIDKCLKRLKSRMDPVNICTIMEVAHTYDDHHLRNECLEIALHNPVEVFQSVVFSELCMECLALIFRDDKLSLEEENIFEAAMLYANQKCLSKGMIVNPENQRLVLGKVLRQIRFPLMDQNYFSDKVEPTGLLSPEECVKVMKYFMKKDHGCDIFITTPRTRRNSVFRFHEVASGWSYQRNKQDSLIFSSSANILVHGVVIYGSFDIEAEYEINMAIKQVPYYAVVANKPGNRIKTDGAQKLYSILFDKPVAIKKDKEYSISVVFKEGAAQSYKGINGSSEMEQDGIIFKFKKCSKSTNNTTENTGQIPAILYEVLPEENTS